MSTITKQWLQQKIADMEATRDEIPFGLDEDDSNTLAAMKLALASLEAEAVGYMNRFTGRVFTLEEQPGADTDAQVYVPVYAAPPAPAQSEPIAWLWSHRKHPSEVTLVRPEDDELAEPGLWSGWSCQALYAAPPAPVGSAELRNRLKAEGLAELLKDASENAPLTAEQWETLTNNWFQTFAGLSGEDETCRAAMLQGAEPVTTAYKLPELTDSQCLEFLAVAFRHASIKGDIEFDDIRLGLKMALDAAPQQEVQP